MFSSEELEKYKEEYDELEKKPSEFINLLKNAKEGDLSYNFLAWIYHCRDFALYIRDKFLNKEFRTNFINSLKWLAENGVDRNETIRDIHEINFTYQEQDDNNEINETKNFEKYKEEYNSVSLAELLTNQDITEFSYKFIAFVYVYNPEYRYLIYDKFSEDNFKHNLIKELMWISENSGKVKEINKYIYEIITIK